ncbi:MAG: MarR family transcriptional regulator [Streptosporangiales bacterium]|nr:MarR family transcriptional regulator [Streptosporangiales bacterium]
MKGTTTSPPAARLGLAESLARLSNLVQRAFVEVGRRYDLTAQQAQFLCRLTEGPVGMTELTRMLHLEKSSLTGLVDRLERRGLVARTPHSCDRRAHLVALTRQGTRAAADYHDDLVARLETMTCDLPPADRRHLEDLLGQVLAGVADDASAQRAE